MGFLDSLLPMPQQLGGLTMDPMGMDMVRRQAISALGASLLGSNAVQDPGGAFGQGLLGSIGIQQQGIGAQYRVAAEQAERERQAQRDALYAQQIQAQTEAQRALAEYRSQPQVDQVQQRADYDLARDKAFIDSLDLPDEQKTLLWLNRQLGGNAHKALGQQQDQGDAPDTTVFGGQRHQWDGEQWVPLGSAYQPQQPPRPPAEPRPVGLLTSQQFDTQVSQYLRDTLPGATPEELAEGRAEYERQRLSQLAPEELTDGLRARATSLGIVPLTGQPPPAPVQGTPLQPSPSPATQPPAADGSQAFTGAQAALAAGIPRELVAERVQLQYGMTLEQLGL